MRDVVVASGQVTRVPVSVPRAGEIALERRGMPDPQGAYVRLQLRPIQARAVEHPGRGQAGKLKTLPSWIRHSRKLRVVLGAQYDLTAHAVRSEVQPNGVRRETPVPEVAIHLSAKRVAAGDRVVVTTSKRHRARVTVDDGARVTGHGLQLELRRGDDVASKSNINMATPENRGTDLWGAEGSYIVHWKGYGWSAGSSAVTLGAHDTPEIRIAPTWAQPARSSTGPSPYVPPEPVETVIRTTSPGQLAKDTPLLLSTPPERGEVLCSKWSADRATISIDDETFEGKRVSVVRGDFIARLGSIRLGGTHDASLVLGGYLVVVVLGQTPPAEDPKVSLRRQDGEVLWVRENLSDAYPKPEMQPLLQNGLVLGPMASGTHTLRVRSGVLPAGTISATVVPGRTQLLVVRIR